MSWRALSFSGKSSQHVSLRPCLWRAFPPCSHQWSRVARHRNNTSVHNVLRSLVLPSYPATSGSNILDGMVAFLPTAKTIRNMRHVAISHILKSERRVYGSPAARAKNNDPLIFAVEKVPIIRTGWISPKFQHTSGHMF